jgi:hypothetical protein
MLSTHSCDVLLLYIQYTKQILFFPSLCSNLNEMSYSSDILSTLLQLDMYVYINYPPIARFLAEPHLDFGTFVASMDT